MSKLAPRRFPDRITRLRTLEGGRNKAGEWLPGEVDETELRASVQPVALEDSDIAGGVSVVERIKVYVPEPDSLMAAFDEVEADRVRWQGRDYVVKESRSWTRGHCRAVCLRET